MTTLRVSTFVAFSLLAACGGNSPALDGSVGASDANRPARLDAPAAVDAPGDARPAVDKVPPAFALPAPGASGTRLKTRVLRTGSAGVEYRGLFDTMLQVPCAVQTASDGKPRCLPISPSIRDLGVATLYYLDAACADQALPGTAECSAAFGFRSTASGMAIHKLGPVIKPATLYRVVEGQCQAFPTNQPSSLYSLGDEIPPATFVEAVPFAPAAGGPRVQAIVDQFADGTRVRRFGTLWDAELKVPCQVAPASDGVFRCLPVTPLAATSKATYEDAFCTDWPTAAITTAEPPPFWQLSAGQGDCPLRRLVRPVAKVPLTKLFRLGSTGKCEPFVPPAGPIKYHSLGSDVTALRLAPFALITRVDGRLESKWVIGEDGLVDQVASDFWFDTVSQRLCSFLSTAAGLRCLQPTWVATFAGANCDERVAVSVGGVCMRKVAPGVLLTLLNGPWCHQEASVATGGDTIPGGSSPLSYTSLLGACDLVPLPFLAYRLGPTVDAATFEKATETLE